MTSAKARMKAARIAPGTLPTPPRMITAKAFSSSGSPLRGSTPECCIASSRAAAPVARADDEQRERRCQHQRHHDDDDLEVGHTHAEDLGGRDLEGLGVDA